MTLTKQKLIDSVHEKIGLPKVKCGRMINHLLEIVSGTLENGEDVLVSGFGKLSVKDNRKRIGRASITGERSMPDSRKWVTFKCSPVLKDKLNGERR
jgi:integration host factor subunit alpha